MIALRRLLHSTIGMKYVVAVTGALLFLFVLAHMAGNLQIFLGAETYNAYAAGIKNMPGLLWAARLGLLAVFVIHIGFTIRLVQRNQEARPVAYGMKKPVESTPASRTMIYSGLLVLAYVIYHLLHFTVGVTHPEHFSMIDAKGRHDVYSMFVLSFKETPVAVSYIGANLILGMHLFHGLGSLFQTLGLNHRKTRCVTQKIGFALAGLIILGNVIMPLSIWMGWLKYMPLKEG